MGPLIMLWYEVKWRMPKMIVQESTRERIVGMVPYLLVMSYLSVWKIMLIFLQAIKEAQKTLDKALDIQEGDEPAQDKQGKALLCEKSRDRGPP